MDRKRTGLVLHRMSTGISPARWEVTSNPQPDTLAASRNRPRTGRLMHSQLSMQTVLPGTACRIAAQATGVSRHECRRTRWARWPCRTSVSARRTRSVDFPLPCGPTIAAVPPRLRARSSSISRSTGRPMTSSGSMQPGLVNRVANGFDATVTALQGLAGGIRAGGIRPRANTCSDTKSREGSKKSRTRTHHRTLTITPS